MEATIYQKLTAKGHRSQPTSYGMSTPTTQPSCSMANGLGDVLIETYLKGRSWGS